MNEIAITRTPEIVAAEINSIKEQTRNLVLFNSIEIGRKLVEAKSMLDHGKWGDWLKSSVDYSQSTANNLMRIFEEYGSDQTALFGDNAKCQALGNLTYTQAVALLGVQVEDREEFVRNNDIENMSTRELQKTIKERDKAIKDLDKYKKQLETITKTSQEAIDERDRLKKQLSEAKTEEEFNTLQDQLNTAQEKVNELTQKLSEPVTVESTIVEKIPDEVKTELAQLREKVQNPDESAIMKYRIYFELLTKCFSNLLGTLSEFKDSETQDKYKGAVQKLVSKMSENL